MADAHLEILVEPFRENNPGPHVTAVLDAAAAAGLNADMGPFATTVDGDVDQLADAIADMIRAGFRNGATALQLRIDAT
ncbi:thiamine-binding protein [uncultured Ilumatobacter sp.]|uniref:thiamine-binding protein n=1 Tax=uncultured Ilumatobacter sp. TaxID=879968 RepID=UPI00374F62AB